jgi:hypothetical protein
MTWQPLYLGGAFVGEIEARRLFVLSDKESGLKFGSCAGSYGSLLI